MSLEDEIVEVDPEVAEYCEEICYRTWMEVEGLCYEDDCIDWGCYNECVKSFYKEVIK